MSTAIVTQMASTQGMDPKTYEMTVRETCGCSGATDEQFCAFLLVAREYGLNPLVKEIYAFPSKAGGVTPIVSIDGWLRMANDHEAFDGLTFEDQLDANGNLLAITARVHRKDRAHPSEVTEYLAECKRNTDPWKQWPARMLRHKAAIQAIRYGLGFSGISDPDEGERMLPVPEPKVVSVIQPQPKLKAITVVAGDEDMDKARAAIDTASSDEQLRKFALAVHKRQDEGFYTSEQAAELLDMCDERKCYLEDREEVTA